MIGSHWIVASNIGCNNNIINVFDSAYSTVHEETMKVIKNLFDISDDHVIEVVKTQKQVGGNDCGLFTIATATSILFGFDISTAFFCQQKMRSPLLHCYDMK